MGSFWTRDWNCVPCIGRWILNHWISRDIQESLNLPAILGKHKGYYPQIGSEKLNPRGGEPGWELRSLYHSACPKELYHHCSFLSFFLSFFLASLHLSKDPPRSEPIMLGHLLCSWCQGRMFAFISGGARPRFHALLSSPLVSYPPKINFLSFGFLFCFLALIPRTFSWLSSIPLIWSSIFCFQDTSQAWSWK